MTCLIVDNDPIAQEIIAQLIKSEKSLNLTGICGSAEEALKAMNATPVDLMFLDIEMPDKNGLDFLQNLDVRPIVIIVSGREKYAFKSYELNAADYLLKPISPTRFSQAVEKAKVMLDVKGQQVEIKLTDFVFLKDKSVLHKISFADIGWLEACGDYVKIHTRQRSFMLHSSLKALEGKLPPAFIRVHRSYIISLSRIDRIEESLVYIGNKAVPVSDAYWDNLRSKLNVF